MLFMQDFDEKVKASYVRKRHLQQIERDAKRIRLTLEAEVRGEVYQAPTEEEDDSDDDDTDGTSGDVEDTARSGAGGRDDPSGGGGDVAMTEA